MGSLALNEVRGIDGNLVLTVSGVVDDTTVGRFETGLHRARGAASHQVIVDLTACWLESAGLAAQVGLHRRIRAPSADTRLVVSDVELLRFLQLVGLTAQFPTYMTMEAARHVPRADPAAAGIGPSRHARPWPRSTPHSAHHGRRGSPLSRRPVRSRALRPESREGPKR